LEKVTEERVEVRKPKIDTVISTGKGVRGLRKDTFVFIAGNWQAALSMLERKQNGEGEERRYIAMVTGKLSRTRAKPFLDKHHLRYQRWLKQRSGKMAP